MPLEFIGKELPKTLRSSDIEAGVLALVEELKVEPNSWACVDSFPEDPAKAHRRREQIRKHAPAEVEVTVQTPDVYAMYVVADNDES